jgi:transposase InsO family protein
MDRDIERICKSCTPCQAGKMRREKIKSEFDALGPQSKAGPRQHYGMDFYGLMKGEVLAIVDLFTRETILQWLPCRKQEQVAKTILRRVIFERGVPLSIRSDSAPELMKGVIHRICSYLNIKQIVTGGHNPRGNAICERANQTLGNMIRKLSDKEYNTLKTLALPAFQYAMNITPHSSIGCSPFEVGHGLPAQSVAHARLLAQQTLADGEVFSRKAQLINCWLVSREVDRVQQDLWTS